MHKNLFLLGAPYSNSWNNHLFLGTPPTKPAGAAAVKPTAARRTTAHSFYHNLFWTMWLGGRYVEPTVFHTTYVTAQWKIITKKWTKGRKINVNLTWSFFVDRNQRSMLALFGWDPREPPFQEITGQTISSTKMLRNASTIKCFEAAVQFTRLWFSWYAGKKNSVSRTAGRIKRIPVNGRNEWIWSYSISQSLRVQISIDCRIAFGTWRHGCNNLFDRLGALSGFRTPLLLNGQPNDQVVIAASEGRS